MRFRMLDILPMNKVPTKCKFCGGSMDALAYPKYTQSSCVNMICQNRITDGGRRKTCNAHFYGSENNKPRWFSGEEWEEFVNAEVS